MSTCHEGRSAETASPRRRCPLPRAFLPPGRTGRHAGRIHTCEDVSPRAPPGCSAVRVGPTAPAAPGPSSQTAHGSPHHRAGGKAERTPGRTADCVQFDSADTSRRAPGSVRKVQVGPNGSLPMSPGLAQEGDAGGKGAGVEGRRVLLDVGTVSQGWDGRQGGSFSMPRGILLTSRLVPGPLTGNPRVLSSSIAPKIYKEKQTCQSASGGP